MKKEIEPYYQKRAEEFIDLLFDKGYFGAEIKRKDMRDVEEFLAFLFQSYTESAVMANNFTRQVRKTEDHIREDEV